MEHGIPLGEVVRWQTKIWLLIYITHHCVEPSLCMVPRQRSKNITCNPCIFSLYRGQHHQDDYASHDSEVKSSRQSQLNMRWLLFFIFSAKRDHPNPVVPQTDYSNIGLVSLSFNRASKTLNGGGNAMMGICFWISFFLNWTPGLQISHFGAWVDETSHHVRGKVLLLGSFFRRVVVLSIIFMSW